MKEEVVEDELTGGEHRYLRARPAWSFTFNYFRSKHAHCLSRKQHQSTVDTNVPNVFLRLCIMTPSL